MEQTECSETSAYKIQTPGNYPEENIQQDEKCFGEKCGEKLSKNLMSYTSHLLRSYLCPVFDHSHTVTSEISLQNALGLLQPNSYSFCRTAHMPRRRSLIAAHKN
jgi:hypothetical protein